MTVASNMPDELADAVLATMGLCPVEIEGRWVIAAKTQDRSDEKESQP